MKRPLLIVAAQLLAFWPVWRWYAARLAALNEETWGLLALATAALVLWKNGPKRNDERGTMNDELRDKSFPFIFHRPSLIITSLILVYAATYPFFSPLPRALVAVACVACTLCRLRLGRLLHVGTLGLFCLSLPVLPSLQFYGGYPLRAFVAAAAAPLLRLGGFAVVAEGACLDWAGQLVWVDAPCSGIRMLWVGLYLACALACLHGLSNARTLCALAAAFASVVFGNVLRATALFYFEAGVIEPRPFAHESVGVTAFALVACATVAAAQFFREQKPCDVTPSTSGLAH